MDDEWAPILITLQRILQSLSEAKFQTVTAYTELH